MTAGDLELVLSSADEAIRRRIPEDAEGKAALARVRVELQGRPAAGPLARLTEDHNGWANRGTWSLWVWISNDEDTWRIARTVARAVRGPRAQEVLRQTIESTAAMRSTHTHPLAQELLGWALDTIDWPAIVAALRED